MLEFQVRLKRELVADLDAHAMPVLQDTERRRVFCKILAAGGGSEQVEERMKGSPLVPVSVELPA